MIHPMRRKGKPSTKAIKRHTAVGDELFSGVEEKHLPMMAELRRRAESTLRGQQLQKRLKSEEPVSKTDAQRLFHELEVHQIELELQNAELHQARNELEKALEQYTDLYDFAPAGYFSVDQSGMILGVNLAGAALFGLERSLLVKRRLSGFVVPGRGPVLLAFLERIFSGAGKQACEMEFLKPDAARFWASVHGVAALAADGSKKWCRLVVSDLTPLKEAQEVKRRLEGITVANLELQEEIDRRRAVEVALKESDQEQKRLLEQSRQMHEQLRHLSRQILRAQEDERRKISRELHDVIAQTLTGISIRLASLNGTGRARNKRDLDRDIAATQRVVERAVRVVHQFARDLRPAVLDDLGLIPALHSFMKSFTSRTGIRTYLTAAALAERLDVNRRTILFRVAQEALTNVARHAGASRVDVDIRKLPGWVHMKISDDGRSFDVQRVMHSQKTKHLGLLGMRERLEMVGGHFDVESAPGKGTTIEAQIPLRKLRGGGADGVR